MKPTIIAQKNEEPPFIGDWYRERKLGTGAFGVVNLWKNKKTNQCVGKYGYSFGQIANLLFPN